MPRYVLSVRANGIVSAFIVASQAFHCPNVFRVNSIADSLSMSMQVNITLPRALTLRDARELQYYFSEKMPAATHANEIRL